MSDGRRSFRSLAKLLPAGALGLSIGLAVASAHATTSSDPANGNVAARLKAIRSSVSAVVQDAAAAEAPDDAVQLAWWGNGWHRGWGNGGWGNGGWHNWGNGGWHNWGNGWHNW
jgi:rSAM-associated Gly-rich repeat protein